MSSNTGKSIMNQFRYPVTLTFVQFFFVASFCALFMSPLVRFSKFRPPTRAIFNATLPMGAFQVGGHIFSSMAISRIPVSTVHTIKALSPLFTVAAYAILFNVSYSPKTYISLLPLTIGVMLVCTFDISGSNFLGLSCAFGSAIIFVSSNILFKKVMPSNSQSSSHKLDKLNLLFYSSGMAFVLMIPVWLYYDFPILMATYYAPKHYTYLGGDDEKRSAAIHSVLYYFFLNGTVHFAQNIIAFVILSSTSPVTYSIASLIKRVAVICIAILWFAQPVHPVQAIGIAMAFTGLYMYNQAKGDVEKGEHKMRRVEAARDMRLPLAKDSIQHLVTPIHPIAINVSATSARDRSWSSPIQSNPTANFPHHVQSQKQFQIVSPTTDYSQPSHNPPRPHQTHNLHIKVHPPSVPVSPRDGDIKASYPSPPESVDSPPASPPLSGGPQENDFDSWMSRRVVAVPVQ